MRRRRRRTRRGGGRRRGGRVSHTFIAEQPDGLGQSFGADGSGAYGRNRSDKHQGSFIKALRGCCDPSQVGRAEVGR